MPDVFVCYSRQDQSSYQDLLSFLRPVCASKRLTFFADQLDIESGEEWHRTIQQNLASARVAIVLVSQNLLNSTYVLEHELPTILQRHRAQQMRMFWILLSTSTFELQGLDKFQSAGTNPSRPLEDMPAEERKRIWKSLCTEKIPEYLRQVRGSKDSARSIYVSQVIDEALEQPMERLKAELKEQQYAVVPSDPLPQRWRDAEPIIRSQMRSADMFIGLVGSDFPSVAQGYNDAPGTTILQLENGIAHDSGIPRLLWVPSEMPREGAVKRLASAIHVAEFDPAGYEWRERGIEELIGELLSTLRSQRDRSNTESAATPQCYLLPCHEQDHPVRSMAEGAQKVLTIKSTLEGSKAWSVAMQPSCVANLDSLLLSDAYIIFYGQGDPEADFWGNLTVCQRAAAAKAARKDPFRKQILVLSDPENAYKMNKLYPQNNLTVVEQYGAFQPKAFPKI